MKKAILKNIDKTYCSRYSVEVSDGIMQGECSSDCHHNVFTLIVQRYEERYLEKGICYQVG